jgi:hypothetical protein
MWYTSKKIHPLSSCYTLSLHPKRPKPLKLPHIQKIIKQAKWMHTHKIPLQNPLFSKVSYYNIKRGKYTHKVSQSLNIPTHRAFKTKNKRRQIHKIYFFLKISCIEMLGFRL